METPCIDTQGKYPEDDTIQYCADQYVYIFLTTKKGHFYNWLSHSVYQTTKLFLNLSIMLLFINTIYAKSSFSHFLYFYIFQKLHGADVSFN